MILIKPDVYKVIDEYTQYILYEKSEIGQRYKGYTIINQNLNYLKL
jgi:hypothetical protein